MKKNYIHIGILLDRSGSMSTVIDEMKQGILSYIEEQKKLEGDITVSMSVFDTQYDKVAEMLDVRNGSLDLSKVYARGGTALVDSFCRMINETGENLARLEEEQRPEKVLFVCVTDGYENASREFTKLQLKEKITHQEKNYNWQFVYLGADHDVFAEANSYNFAGTKTAMFSKSRAGIRKMSEDLSFSTQNYRSAAGGASADFMYQEKPEEKEKKKDENNKTTPEATPPKK